MKIEDVKVGMRVRRTRPGDAIWEAVGLEMVVTHLGGYHDMIVGTVAEHGEHTWLATSCEAARIPLKKGQRVTRTVCDVLYTGVCIENERPDGDIIILCDGDANSVVTVATYWELVPETPPTLRNTHMTATFTEAESRAQMAFFSTPVTPNTCRKCAAPTPCKYHE